jgi:hypothetical protein
MESMPIKPGGHGDGVEATCGLVAGALGQRQRERRPAVCGGTVRLRCYEGTETPELLAILGTHDLDRCHAVESIAPVAAAAAAAAAAAVVATTAAAVTTAAAAAAGVVEPLRGRLARRHALGYFSMQVRRLALDLALDGDWLGRPAAECVCLGPGTRHGGLRATAQQAKLLQEASHIASPTRRHGHVVRTPWVPKATRPVFSPSGVAADLLLELEDHHGPDAATAQCPRRDQACNAGTHDNHGDALVHRSFGRWLSCDGALPQEFVRERVRLPDDASAEHTVDGHGARTGEQQADEGVQKHQRGSGGDQGEAPSR